MIASAETGEADSGAGRRWTQVYRGDDPVLFQYCREAGDETFSKNQKASEEEDEAVYFT